MIFTVYIVQTKLPALLLYPNPWIFFLPSCILSKGLKTTHTKFKGHKLTSPKKTQTKETQHWSKPSPRDHKRSINTCWKPNVERATRAETSPHRLHRLNVSTGPNFSSNHRNQPGTPRRKKPPMTMLEVKRNPSSSTHTLMIVIRRALIDLNRDLIHKLNHRTQRRNRLTDLDRRGNLLQRFRF